MLCLSRAQTQRTNSFLFCLYIFGTARGDGDEWQRNAMSRSKRTRVGVSRQRRQLRLEARSGNGEAAEVLWGSLCG
jgi:hypothetical protein